MRTVKNFINEKFSEDSDPIHDMGIGIFYPRTFNSKKDLARFLYRNIGPITKRYGYEHSPEFLKRQSRKDIHYLHDNYLNAITNYLEEFVTDVYIKYKELHLEYYHHLNPKYDGYSAEFLRLVHENIDEAFIEDSDPIDDMGIGTRHLISKWMKEIGEKDVDNNALIHCSKEGKVDWVKFLLDRGADVHAYFEDPLQRASRNGHTEVVKLLLDRGADVQAGDNRALRWASKHGHTEVVKLLLDRGANVHVDNADPLQWASENGHIEVVKLLLDRGADVHANNDYALRWASKKGHTKVVKLLLDRGADVHANNDYALRWANDEVIKVLKDHMKKNPVTESLLEKFTEDSDPIDDMGIGARNLIKNWYKKIRDLDEKLSTNFKFKFLTWDLSATPSRVPDEKDIKNPMLIEDIAEKLISSLFLRQDALFFVFYSNKIVYETPSGDYKYIQKIEYANDILEQLNLLSFLEFESVQSDYGTNEIKYAILPEYVDYFKEGLKESLNEKFTEDSDPIDDMGIGKKHLIEKWLKKQSTKYPGYQFTYTIINDKEISLSGSLLLMENIPDYIQLKYIDGNVILNKGVSSFKGLPNKINGYLSINSKDITSLDGAPNDLNVSVFFKNEIDKEEIKKYVKRAADENRNISVNSYYNDGDLWTKNNIQVEHFLNESLFEKFTEDSDPIVDMGIGIKLKIKNWLKDNGIYNYTIDSNFEINVEEQLHINENLPDYIQFKIVGHSVYAKNLTSAKGFPRKIERLLQISDSSLNTFDDVPVDLRVTLFLRDVKFPEEELKKYIMRAAKHQTHIKVTNNWQEQTFYPSNNYGGYI